MATPTREDFLERMLDKMRGDHIQRGEKIAELMAIHAGEAKALERLDEVLERMKAHEADEARAEQEAQEEEEEEDDDAEPAPRPGTAPDGGGTPGAEEEAEAGGDEPPATEGASGEDPPQRPEDREDDEGAPSEDEGEAQEEDEPPGAGVDPPVENIPGEELKWVAELVDDEGVRWVATDQNTPVLEEVISTRDCGSWVSRSFHLGPFVIEVAVRPADEVNGPRIGFSFENSKEDATVGYYESFVLYWGAGDPFELPARPDRPDENGNPVKRLRLLPQTKAHVRELGIIGTPTRKPWEDRHLCVDPELVDNCLDIGSAYRFVEGMPRLNNNDGSEGGAWGISRHDDWLHTEKGVDYRRNCVEAWAFRQPIFMRDKDTLEPLQYRGPYSFQGGGNVRTKGATGWTVRDADAVPGFKLFPDGRSDDERGLYKKRADDQHAWRAARHAIRMRRYMPTAHIVCRFILNELRITENWEKQTQAYKRSKYHGFWNLRSKFEANPTAGKPASYMGREQIHKFRILHILGTEQEREMIRNVVRHHAGASGIVYQTQGSMPPEAKAELKEVYGDAWGEVYIVQIRELQLALDLMVQIGLDKEAERLRRELPPIPRKVHEINQNGYKLGRGYILKALDHRTGKMVDVWAPLYHLWHSNNPRSVHWGPYGNFDGLVERAKKDSAGNNALDHYPDEFKELQPNRQRATV